MNKAPSTKPEQKNPDMDTRVAQLKAENERLQRERSTLAESSDYFGGLIRKLEIERLRLEDEKRRLLSTLNNLYALAATELGPVHFYHRYMNETRRVRKELAGIDDGLYPTTPDQPGRE